MNTPIKSDREGNYIIGKRNVYFSLALVLGIVVSAGYTVNQATSFQYTLDWNTRQIAKIITTQEKHSNRLTEIELKANRLEWRIERLDGRLPPRVGDAGPLMGAL